MTRSSSPLPRLGEGENDGNLDVLGCNASQHIQISEFHPLLAPLLGERRGRRSKAAFGG
jgi:hypothetical protein